MRFVITPSVLIGIIGTGLLLASVRHGGLMIYGVILLGLSSALTERKLVARHPRWLWPIRILGALAVAIGLFSLAF
jgi:hypothetical protein